MSIEMLEELFLDLPTATMGDLVDAVEKRYWDICRSVIEEGDVFDQMKISVNKVLKRLRTMQSYMVVGPREVEEYKKTRPQYVPVLEASEFPNDVWEQYMEMLYHKDEVFLYRKDEDLAHTALYQYVWSKLPNHEEVLIR